MFNCWDDSKNRANYSSSHCTPFKPLFHSLYLKSCLLFKNFKIFLFNFRFTFDRKFRILNQINKTWIISHYKNSIKFINFYYEICLILCLAKNMIKIHIYFLGFIVLFITNLAIDLFQCSLNNSLNHHRFKDKNLNFYLIKKHLNYSL